MSLKEFFVKDFETRDEHNITELKTHYYRCRVEDAMDAINNIVKEVKGKIIDVNDFYNEILFDTDSYRCICKITATTPVETAIDFKVSTFGLFSFGKGKKVITEIYQKLDKILPFKGIGLFKGM